MLEILMKQHSRGVIIKMNNDYVKLEHERILLNKCDISIDYTDDEAVWYYLWQNGSSKWEQDNIMITVQ